MSVTKCKPREIWSWGSWKIKCEKCGQSVYAKSLDDARKKFEMLWRCEQ